jgi:hypothetical protein
LSDTGNLARLRMHDASSRSCQLSTAASAARRCISSILSLMFVDHVIVSTAPKARKGVKAVQVGDRVGLGMQIASCYECGPCMNDNEG